MQEQPFQEAVREAGTSEADSIRNGCVSECRSNGYSPARAGAAATNACVDVCVEEKGQPSIARSRPQINALSPRTMNTLRSRSVHVRGHSEPINSPMAAAQRLLSRLQAGPSDGSSSDQAASLQAAMSALRVNGMKMPQAQAELLAKALKMDGIIGDEEEKTANGLQKQWKTAEKKMITMAAARLTNAKNLARAAVKAEQQNVAKRKLDASLMAAAQHYAQTVGSEHGLPLDAAKAEKQLAASEADDTKLRATAATAAEIYRRVQPTSGAGGMCASSAATAGRPRASSSDKHAVARIAGAAEQTRLVLTVGGGVQGGEGAVVGGAAPHREAAGRGALDHAGLQH